MLTKTFVSSAVTVISMMLAWPVMATTRMPEVPLENRVREAEKVFVGVLVNLKKLEGDWCHADLKVTLAIKGVEVGQLVPVQWRPKIAYYDAEENQEGLAVLKYKDGGRYWLRSDTLVDSKLAQQAVKFLEKARKPQP